MKHTIELFNDRQVYTPTESIHVDVDKFVESSLKKRRKRKVNVDKLLTDLSNLFPELSTHQ